MVSVRFLSALGIAGLALAAPLAAQAADDTPRFYAALNVGFSISPNVTATVKPVSETGSFSFSAVPVGGGAVGVGMYGFRLEEELSYRGPGISNFSVNGTNVGAGGYLGGLAFMTNLFYDYYITKDISVNVGAGVGIAELSARGAIGGLITTNDSDSAFAYQAMLGVSDQIMPNVTVGLMYRYFGTTDGTFAASVAGAGVGSFKASLAANEVVGSMRFGF